MSEQNQFHIKLRQKKKYAFEVEFDWDIDRLTLDETKPLGDEQGPNAARLLAAAAANCLSASLLFCMQKNHVSEDGLETDVVCTIDRNNGRMRVSQLHVQIHIQHDHPATKLHRCTEMFEEFCVVTGSLRQGLPVAVQVFDNTGTLIHKSE